MIDQALANAAVVALVRDKATARMADARGVGV